LAGVERGGAAELRALGLGLGYAFLLPDPLTAPIIAAKAPQIMATLIAIFIVVSL
jgi:hypothetical protein